MAITTIYNELIAVNAISGTLIADNAITSVHIATNAISGLLVADNSITTIHIAANNVTSTSIVANAITSTQLADNAVIATKIPDGIIATAHLADNAVTAAKIPDNVLTATMLPDNVILATHIPSNITLTTSGALTTTGAFTSLGIDDNADAVAITIDSSERVGIGTNSPAANLHVDASGGGVIRVTRLGSNASNKIQIEHDGTNGTITSTNDVIFNTGGSEKVRIESGGDVGIGITNPTTKLSIQDSTASDSNNIADWIGSDSGQRLIVANFLCGSDEDRVGLYWEHQGVGNMRMWMGDDLALYTKSGNPSNDTDGNKFIQADGSGNVGLGVTPEANWRSSVKALDIGSTGAVWDGHTYTILANNIYEHTDTNRKHKANGYGSYIQQYLGNIYFTNTTSGSADANISESTRMTIAAAGNVGIGTTSPSAKLHVYTSGAEGINIGIQNSERYYNIETDGGLLMFKDVSAGGLTRMSINTAGNMGIGLTSYNERLKVSSSDGNTAVVAFEHTGTAAQQYGIHLRLNGNPNDSTRYFLQCVGGASGSDTVHANIYSNGNITNTNNSYGSTSDVTIKENIIDATNKLSDLKQVKVRNFNLIGESDKQIGMIAQELETIFPSLVFEDEETEKKSIKYSVFVPILIKAMQELEARLTAGGL